MARTRSLRSFGITLIFSLLLFSIGIINAYAQDPGDEEELQLGAQLYAENCAVCHGVNGQGRVGATLSKDWPSINPSAFVRTTIANGIPGSFMPAWSQAKGGPFSEPEVDAVTAFILSWQTAGFTEFVPPPATPRPPITPVPDVDGDPNHGAVLFDENCAVCHGQYGEGRIGANLAKNWPSIRPDLTVRAAISQGIPGSAMPAWSQAHGGPLSGADIDDIVSYIMTLPSIEAGGAVTEPTSDTKSSPFSGLAGVLVAVVLFGAIVAVIIWMQRRTSS